MIDEYKFTSIEINGEKYFNDVKVSKNGVEEWGRVDDRLVQVVDFRCAVKEKPDIIIVGIGSPMFLEVTPEAQDFIKERGISLLIEPTEKAIQSYNILSRMRNVVALIANL